MRRDPWEAAEGDRRTEALKAERAFEIGAFEILSQTQWVEARSSGRLDLLSFSPLPSPHLRLLSLLALLLSVKSMALPQLPCSPNSDPHCLPERWQGAFCWSPRLSFTSSFACSKSLKSFRSLTFSRG